MSENIYIPYQNERIEGAIAFFASEHKKKTKENLCQTALYKYLAFFDFKSLEETGEPALGLTYKAMERGPVPVEIYINKKFRKSVYYHFEEEKYKKNGKEETAVYIVPHYPKKKIYLNYFSEFDLEIMKRHVYFFASNWVTAKVMSDASHEKRDGIRAWGKTWNKKHNAVIDMADTFSEKETAAKEHFKVYQYLHA